MTRRNLRAGGPHVRCGTTLYAFAPSRESNRCRCACWTAGRTLAVGRECFELGKIERAAPR